MELQYHPETVRELNKSIEYYNAQRTGLGEEFRDEILETLERIRLNPKRYGIVKLDIRRTFVHRFPFSILYRVVDDKTVRILVIRHHRVRPSYGERRR